MSDIDKKKERLEKAEMLFDGLLKILQERLTAGTITAAEMSILYKMLSDGGFRVDPNDIPKDIQDKLTARISAKELKEGDPDVPEGFVQ